MRAFLVLVVLCGCAEPLAVEPDAGEVDSGQVAKDAGPPPQVDAGRGMDAGELDAGQPDAGGGAIATTMRWRYEEGFAQCSPPPGTREMIRTCEAFAELAPARFASLSAEYADAGCPTYLSDAGAFIECSNCSSTEISCGVYTVSVVTCTPVLYVPETSSCTWNP